MSDSWKKTCEVDAIWNILDWVKTIQRIDASQQPGLTDDTIFFYCGQCIPQITRADQVKCSGYTTNLPGQLSIVDHSLVRF